LFLPWHFPWWVLHCLDPLLDKKDAAQKGWNHFEKNCSPPTHSTILGVQSPPSAEGGCKMGFDKTPLSTPTHTTAPTLSLSSRTKALLQKRSGKCRSLLPGLLRDLSGMQFCGSMGNPVSRFDATPTLLDGESLGQVRPLHRIQTLFLGVNNPPHAMEHA